MAAKRKKPLRPQAFHRTSADWEYRKTFVIVTEGSNTEPQYFRILQSLLNNVRIIQPKIDTKGSPKNLLQKINELLRDNRIPEGAFIWAVHDVDNWPEDDMTDLRTKLSRSSDWGCAVSKPKFEFWLLCHFEEPDGINTSRDCDTRLRKHIPNYNKSLPERLFTKTMIQQACRRSERRNKSLGQAVHAHAHSDVHILVAKMLDYG